MFTESTLIKNRYFDSVFLMRVAKRLSGEPGVHEAAVFMGTPKNLQVLADAGYSGIDTLGASANDLVVSLKTATAEQARDIFGSMDGWLQRERASAGPATVRTLDQALQRQPQSNLAVISVPGEYAPNEARRALESGLNVLLFSNNVSIDDELALKRVAQKRGLLLMGPDCGTSIIGGAGLGFANAVRRGPVGVIGASGTGIQEVTSLVHRWGSGISHAIGIGGRDLSDAIGGISALQAMDALEADPETSVILLISKPPGAQTLPRIDERIAACSKPVVTCYLGVSYGSISGAGAATATSNLDASARAAFRLAGVNPPGDGTLGGELVDGELVGKERASLNGGQQFLRGIFAGGTLCYQAQQVLRDAGIPVHSNEPLDGATKLSAHQPSTGHTLIDMGADEFTQGRAHPMVDSTLRVTRILEEAKDARVGVLLLDVILGYGAAEDPAGDLAEAIRQAKALEARAGAHLTVVASICGTSGDPQGLEAQTRVLEDAGAIVFDTGYRAARFAAALVSALVSDRS